MSRCWHQLAPFSKKVNLGNLWLAKLAKVVSFLCYFCPEEYVYPLLFSSAFPSNWSSSKVGSILDGIKNLRHVAKKDVACSFSQQLPLKKLDNFVSKVLLSIQIILCAIRFYEEKLSKHFFIYSGIIFQYHISSVL